MAFISGKRDHQEAGHSNAIKNYTKNRQSLKKANILDFMGYEFYYRLILSKLCPGR